MIVFSAFIESEYRGTRHERERVRERARERDGKRKTLAVRLEIEKPSSFQKGGSKFPDEEHDFR